MERKEFIKKFAVGGSILLTTPMLFNSCSDDSEDITPTNPDEIVIDLNATSSADLGAVGGFIYSGNIIVFRTGDNAYVALSKLCTHSQCTVSYNHTAGNVPCPCHGSKFSTSGAVLNGPAASALKKYNVKIEANSLIIT